MGWDGMRREGASQGWYQRGTMLFVRVAIGVRMPVMVLVLVLVLVLVTGRAAARANVP
jgi:hypothetical protein